MLQGREDIAVCVVSVAGELRLRRDMMGGPRSVIRGARLPSGTGLWVWRGMRTVWLKGNIEREAGGHRRGLCSGRTELGKSLGIRGASPLTDLHPFIEATVKTKPRSLLRV